MTYRNRTALFFSLLFPIMFMVIFGLIFGRSGASKASLDVVGKGPLVAALKSSGAIELHPRATAQEAVKRVKDGDEGGALVVQGRAATLYYSNADAIQAATLRGIVRGTADAVSIRASGRPPAVEMQARSVDSTSLKYIDFLVPGLLAMALSQSAVVAVSGSLVSMRQRNIFRRLRVTPLPLVEFAIARVLSQLVLALTQTAVLLGVGALAFGVHLSSNVLALVPLVILGALAFIMLGFLLGAFAKTSEAADAVANIVTLPMVFLAGVFFPLDGAPGWLQAVAKVLPLTYLANGLRDVAIRGHSLSAIGIDLAVLGGTSLVLGAIAIRFFRWDST
jgi:ABC-2 type transport system permease protein